MLYLYTGGDRDTIRSEIHKAIGKVRGAETIRITDASPFADLVAVLQGGGMFSGKRAIILEHTLQNDEMRQVVLEVLPTLNESLDEYFLWEEKPDAATKRLLEKHAELSFKFEAPKEKKDGGDIFALAAALRRGDKKTLWVSYQRSLARGERVEAIHGVLFWGAKQSFLNSRTDSERARAGKIVAELSELPHESRRKGFELEYALEKYLLSI